MSTVSRSNVLSFGGSSMMGLCYFIVLLLSVLNGVAGSSEPTGDPAVVTLTKDNFESFLDNGVVLVEFYAPWCGHCKKLAPEYEKAAEKLKEEGSQIKLGQVDATTEADLADKYGVRGYPTLQLFRNKVPEEYSGGRTAETIVEWLKKMTGPAVSEVDTEALKKLREAKPSVAVLGSLKKKDSDLHKMFEKTADGMRHVGGFVAHFADDNKDEIIVIRGDEEEVTFKGKTQEELKTFIGDESFALFGPINGENFKNYAERTQELIWFCGEKQDFEDVKTPVREAAMKYRAEYSFVWLDTEQFKGHAENALGVTEFPALVYQSKNGRFVLPDNAHMKEGSKIIQFLEDVKDGKIEKNLKSEAIPESNDDVVQTVVGKNFETVVLQKDKDVFLEIYAPWCGHCKKVEPILKQVAEALKSVKHIVIAKMDGTANEAPVEDFDWTGFPTFFFVKAGTKTPIKFDGARTYEGMIEYIKKHSSFPINREDIQEPDEKKTDKSEEL